jgi:hypothetical protein
MTLEPEPGVLRAGIAHMSLHAQQRPAPQAARAPVSRIVSAELQSCARRRILAHAIETTGLPGGPEPRRVFDEHRGAGGRSEGGITPGLEHGGRTT